MEEVPPAKYSASLRIPRYLRMLCSFNVFMEPPVTQLSVNVFEMAHKLYISNY
jgi:hypothetical protein